MRSHGCISLASFTALLFAVTLAAAVPRPAHAHKSEVISQDTDFLSLPDRFFSVAPNLYRGARPTADDLATMKAKYGITTIVTLDSNEEEVDLETKAAQKLGIKVISIPLSAFSSPSNADVDRILSHLLKASKNKSVYLHCKQGRDRTGLLIGLYRVFYQQWTRVQAYQEMKEKGFRSILFPLVNYFNYRTQEYP